MNNTVNRASLGAKKNLLNFKWLLLSFVLSIASINTMWAYERTFDGTERVFFKNIKPSGWGDCWIGGGRTGWIHFWRSGYANTSDVKLTLVSGSEGAEGAIYVCTPAAGTYTDVTIVRSSTSATMTWSEKSKDISVGNDASLNYINNLSPSDWDENYGHWSKYAPTPAVIGSMNGWKAEANPATSERTAANGDKIKIIPVTLSASTNYTFRVITGDSQYGKSSLTITGATKDGSWESYSTGDGKDVTITSGEAGEYIFQFNTNSKYVAVYYPKGRFTKNKVVYFDASGASTTYWNKDAFDSKFYFKYYDAGTNVDEGNFGSQIEGTKIYYATVPNNDYAGQIIIDRYNPSDHSDKWNSSSEAYATGRSSSAENCFGITSDSWTPSLGGWTTYCPPTTSESFTDNGTSKIAWQDGGNDGSTSGRAILVKTGTSLKVSASASKAVADNDMTVKYDFKVNSGSTSTNTTGSYTSTASTNNTQYAVNVQMYTNYNLDGTKSSTKHSHTIYYKALDTYSLTHTLTNVTKSAGRTGADAAAYYLPYTATYDAATGYNLPTTITVKFGETIKTAGEDYTWTQATGVLSIPADKIDGNVTVIINGVAKTYSITLDDNGEYERNGSATATYNTTNLTEISAPTRTGYHVTGYYTSDGSLYIADASGYLQASKSGYTDDGSRWTKDADATLYAHWEANTHSLSWNANGGDELTGSYTSGTTAYGTTIVKPNTPTQSGYVFKGWAESESGAVVSVPATMPDADKTYYAQWLSSADVSDCWDGETYKCDGIPNFATPKPVDATTWSSATWGGGTPTLETQVVIPADMEITVDGTAYAKEVVLASTAKLNISSGAALIVANTVNKAGGSTSESDLTLSAGTSVTGNAALIWGESGTTPGAASVGFYSKSHGQAGSSASVNQYIGVPVVTNTSAFGDAWVCHIKYEDNIAVWELHEGTMQPWVGYDLILNTTGSGGSCIMSGTLETNADKSPSLVYKGEDTENLIANSWPAPIKISAFQNSDFTNAEAAIYIFNATSPDAQAKDETMHMGSYSAYTAGTATEVIPSMQSFSVIATSSSPSINLNYKRLVYDPAVASFTNHANYAPRRTAVQEMTSLKINICDAQGWGDELKLFENSTDFSYEFEPGYDAHRLDGSSKAPHLYGLADDGSELAINCVPTMDNLPIGFKASTKDKEYTMSFKYDGEEELVLKDLKNNKETLINNESRYTFTSTSTDDDLRFVVIKKAPQIATGFENTTPNEETKVQKILHNGSLYIIRDGRIYNAEGALVK